MAQALSGLDAAFVYLDTPSTPMQVAQVCVFDPSTTPAGYSFERVRSLLAGRLDRLLPFRRRLVTSPFGLGPPSWVDDPDFDIDEHLTPARLPSPGGIDELERFTEAFIATPLDRSRPLWEMQVVEGLEGGMVAAVTKVHHAAIDGLSGAELTANLLDLEPTPPPDPPPGEWAPDRLPSTLERLGRAGRSWLDQPAATVRAAGAMVGAARRLRRSAQAADALAGAFAAPSTPFNVPVGTKRHVGFAHLDRGDVSLVREAAGATVNEVLLAVCAGALRAYLRNIDHEPSKDLVAAVPISVRTDDLRGTMGNRLSGMLVTLATTVDDPSRRLAAIVGSSRSAKAQSQAIGPDTFADLADALPAVLGSRMARPVAAVQSLLRVRPLFNVTVSTFPGPAFPLYCCGARLLAPYPIGPLLTGAALNITAQTYLDGIHVGITSDPDAVPHGDHLPGLLREALDELVKAHR